MSILQNKNIVDALEYSGGNVSQAASFVLEKWQHLNLNYNTLKTRIGRLKRPKVSKDSAKYEEWLRNDFHVETDQAMGPEGDALVLGNRGRPQKRLSDNPSRNTKAKLVEEPLNYIVNFAEEQGVPLEEVINLLNERCESKKKKEAVQIPVEEACAYFLNGGYSTRSWTELRQFLLRFDVELPTRNEIDIHKVSYQPPILSQEIKCSVDYPSLVKDTTCGLLDVVGAANIGDNTTLELVAKTGIDGSGSHKVRHQIVNTDLSLDENPHLDPSVYTNYLLCCISPLSLNAVSEDGRALLWKNPQPNSTFYARPLTLVRAAESRTIIEHEFESLFTYINDNEQFSIEIAGKQVPLTIKNTVSMVDGKMVGILQGDTGSQKCHYCTVSHEEMNSVVTIIQGFVINKDFKSCMDAWNKIENGEIEWGNLERAGQCEKPLVAVNNFCILHWKLRSFDYALNLLYRLMSGIYIWGKAGQSDRLIAQAKSEAQDHIRKQLGLLIDVPTSGGGTTNNGSVATRFFSQKNRDIICELIKKEEDRDNFKLFLTKMNVMISVCLGNRPGVNTDKLQQLGIDIMSHIRTAFVNHKNQPWVPINPSVHAMCAHSWELFHMSKEPISVYSEQAQEHWNKHVNRFKSGCGSRARQHSVKLNLKDIMSRMLQMTHPVVVAKRRVLKCTICGDVGHTARSKTFHGQGHAIIGTDDEYINELFLNED